MNVEKNDDFEENKKQKSKHNLKKIVVLLAGILVVVALIFAAFQFKNFKQSKKHNSIATYIEGETKEAEVVFTEAELKDVIEISELYTANYTYNSIVKVYDDNSETVHYNVAYEGNVKAGIDFQDISIQIDDTNKKIVVTLPDVKIYDTTVNAGTLEYIFTDQKYNTEDVAQEAYKLCCEDLKEKTERETALYTAAKENAKTAVEALIIPWVEQTDSNYIVDVE